MMNPFSDASKSPIAEIWDGVSRRIEHQIEFCRDINIFLRRRKLVEDDNAKKLHKVIHQFRQSFTSGAQKFLIGFTYEEVKLRDNLPAAIIDAVCEPVEQALLQIEKLHKQLITQAGNLEDDIEDSTTNLRKAKLSYEKHIKSAKTPDAKSRLDSEFQRQLDTTNNFLYTCYYDVFPKIFKELQQLEDTSIEVSKDQLSKIHMIMGNYAAGVVAELQNFMNEIESLCPSKSHQDFLSIFTPPPKFTIDTIPEEESIFRLPQFVKQKRATLLKTAISIKTADPFKEGEDDRVWTLEDILINDFGIVSFRQFLEEDLSIENLLFVEAVDELYELSEEEVSASIYNIYDVYISDEGERCLNIPQHIRSVLVEKFERALSPTSTEDDKKLITKEIFDQAREKIFLLLKNDAFRRFLKSPQFAEFLSQLENSKSNTSKEFQSKQSLQSGGGDVFGVPLDDMLRRQQRDFPDKTVPIFFEALVNRMDALNAYDAENIFRVSSKVETIREIKRQFTMNNFDLSNINDPHLLGALLKAWLRDLPDYVIPSSLYGLFLSTPDRACEYVNKIPTCNRNLLLYLVQFLRKFLLPQHIEKNKLDEGHIAGAFAPCIFGSRSKLDLSTALADLNIEKQCFINFLSNLTARDILISNVSTQNITPFSSVPSSPEPSTTRLSIFEVVSPNQSGIPHNLSDEERVELVSQQIYKLTATLKAAEMERDSIMGELEKAQLNLQQTGLQFKQMYDTLENADELGYKSFVPKFLTRKDRKGTGTLRRGKSETSGELHLKINYTKQISSDAESSLKIEVLEGRNLCKAADIDVCSAYVRIDVGRQKKKTRIVKKSGNPVFNEVFEFKIAGTVDSILVTVKDAHKVALTGRNMLDNIERMARNIIVGFVTIHLQDLEATSNTNNLVTDKWFPLKSSQDIEDSDSQESSGGNYMDPILSTSPEKEVASSPVSLLASAKEWIAPTQTLSASIRQDLKLLEERIQKETDRLTTKITRLQQLNSEIHQLNTSKSELKDELQQLEQMMFVKALNQKESLLEKEKKMATQQKEETDEITKEMEQLKRLLNEKDKKVANSNKHEVPSTVEHETQTSPHVSPRESIDKESGLHQRKRVTSTSVVTSNNPTNQLLPSNNDPDPPLPFDPEKVALLEGVVIIILLLMLFW